MEPTVTEKQLFRSCEILFGSDLLISPDFLNYLQLSGLKTAYRKRVMETHPDRVGCRDEFMQQRNSAPFHVVQEAYENLLGFLKTKDESSQIAEFPEPGKTLSRPPNKATGQAKPRNGSQSSFSKAAKEDEFPQRTIRPITLPNDTPRGSVLSNTEKLYQGPLPHRPLLFGQFLYYSGLANWRTISRILTWQRLDRPRLGELGHRFGIFTQEDITCILQNRTPLQPFGESARRMGILTEYQLQALIAQQKRLQKKFGAILLEKNAITQYELRELLSQFKQHNRIVSPSGR